MKGGWLRCRSGPMPAAERLTRVRPQCPVRACPPRALVDPENGGMLSQVRKQLFERGAVVATVFMSRSFGCATDQHTRRVCASPFEKAVGHWRGCCGGGP